MGFLEQFDYLRNADDSKRTTATLDILRHLKIDRSRDADICSLEQLEAVHGHDVLYTFRRLIKGLSSSRECARLGFSGALSELLRALGHVQIDLMIDQIVSLTAPPHGAKKQEIRDSHFGQLFGLQALQTSGLLGGGNAGDNDVLNVLGRLFQLSLEQGWLRESCCSVIAQIVSSRGSGSIADAAHEMLDSASYGKTIDGIALLVAMRKAGGKREDVDFRHGWVLHKDNLSSVSRILRKASSEGEPVEQTGAAKPKLHFCWPLLLTELIADNQLLTEFWRVTVDEGLFAQSSSSEKKLWGLQLLSLLVQTASADQLEALAMHNTIRCLTNQLANDDRLLHKAAKATTSAMLAVAQADGHKSGVLLSIILRHNILFDRLGKVKLCEQLLQHASAATHRRLVKTLIDSWSLPAKEGDPEKLRLAAADWLANVGRVMVTQASESATLKLLSWAVEVCFFKTPKTKKLSPEISVHSRTALQSRLISIMGFLLNTRPESGVLWSTVVMSHFRKLQSTSLELLVALDDGLNSALSEAFGHLSVLEERASDSSMAEAVQVTCQSLCNLYSIAILQVYAVTDDAVELLHDLEEAYPQVERMSKPGGAHDEPGSADLSALVDIILGLLARESAVVRKLVNMIFRNLVPQLDTEAIDLLLNVLKADEEGEDIFLRGEADLEQDGQELEEGSSESSSSEGSITSDEGSDDDMEEGEGQGEDESDASLDNEFTDEANAALDAALLQALSSSTKQVPKAGNFETQSADADASDEDEELLDDEAMLALDEQLADIFRLRQAQTQGRGLDSSRGKLSRRRRERQERTQRKNDATKFKLKVLDLLDACLSNDNPARADPFEVARRAAPVLCELTASRVTPTEGNAPAATLASKDARGDAEASEALINKALNLVRKIARVPPRTRLSDKNTASTTELVFNTLSVVHGILLKGGAQAACSAASGWLAKSYVLAAQSTATSAQLLPAGSKPHSRNPSKRRKLDNESRADVVRNARFDAVKRINGLYSTTQFAWLASSGGQSVPLADLLGEEQLDMKPTRTLGKTVKQFFVDWLSLAPTLFNLTMTHTSTNDTC
ncbi:DNA-directed DNA polymerase [Savitreella phatthalungensis]